MRLLVLTQNVDKNDNVLGFFHNWIEAMSKGFEEITVVSLGVGSYKLPSNVSVYSLGKEKGVGRLGKIIRFYGYIFKFKNKYDSVFVHMNPEYVLMGGFFWKLWNKPVYLWYVHKYANFILGASNFFVKKIFTANSTSCNLKNKKKIVAVGHGIDADLFAPKERKPADEKIFLSVGRMSPIKKHEITLKALGILVSKYNFLNFKFLLVAPVVNEIGKKYQERIVDLLESNGYLKERVKIVFGVPYGELPEYYNNADVMIHSGEGGADKVVLEAMSTGLPVIVSSEAFSFLPEKYKFKKDDSGDLAEKIYLLINSGQGRDMVLRDIIIRDYGLSSLLKKIKIYML